MYLTFFIFIESISLCRYLVDVIGIEYSNTILLLEYYYFTIQSANIRTFISALGGTSISRNFHQVGHIQGGNCGYLPIKAKYYKLVS